jgi:hypothetical protein
MAMLSLALVAPLVVVLLQLAAAQQRRSAGVVDIPGAEVAVFVLPFLALTFLATCLALAGLPRLTIIPVGTFVALGFVPEAPSFSEALLGLLLDHPGIDRLLGGLLALVPALALTRAGVVRALEPSKLDWPAGRAIAAGALVALLAALITALTWSIVDGSSLFSGSDRAWTLVAFGACISLAGWRWLLAILPASLLFAGVVHSLLTPEMPAFPGWVTTWVFLSALAVEASLWLPAARLVQRFEARPAWLFAMINLLNVLDAVFTWFVVSSGRGTEANPVIRALGLPIKVVVVALASGLILRLRPKWLWVPLVAMVAVNIWHLSGLVINQP